MKNNQTEGKGIKIIINKMWLDKEKTRYDCGWNSALAELEARLKVTTTPPTTKYENKTKKR
jgi:hypothetical protein